MQSPEKRQRNIDRSQSLGYGFDTNWNGSYWQGPTQSDWVYSERSSIADSGGHYGYPNFPPVGNVGGAVNIISTVTNRGVKNIGECYFGTGTWGYKGSVVCWANPVSLATYQSPDAWGPDAYAKMKPTKPSMEGWNALYELKDLPMMLKQRFLQNGLSSIGDYYLALKFGWEPLLRDVRNMVQTQQTMQKRLKQLLRDNGKPVRMRRELAHSTTEPLVSSGTSYGNISPGFGSTGFYRKQGLWTSTEYTTNRVWASARMRYWLPGGPRDIAWKRSMMFRLYGLRPSPRAVYNMIPWSWLVDWFTNAGSCLENMDAGVADRLAYDYCYVMREWQSVRLMTGAAHLYHKGGSPYDIELSSTSVATSRGRGYGDPFGWASKESDLSSTQWAILGALGLSRLR